MSFMSFNMSGQSSKVSNGLLKRLFEESNKPIEEIDKIKLQEIALKIEQDVGMRKHRGKNDA